MYKTIFLDLSEAEKYAKNEVHTFFWNILNFDASPYTIIIFGI